MTMRRRSFGDEAAIEAATDHLLRRFDPLDEIQEAPDAALAVGAAALEPAFLVAASDAAPETKEVAHFICDGTNDEVEINDALTALPNPTPVGGKSTGPRGVVTASEGVFHCNGDVDLPGGTALLGRGKGTLFDSNGTTGLRFMLNQECELGNFGLTETTARSGAAAIIDANGSPDELLIHDIYVFRLLSPTTHFIDLKSSSSGGRIWNNYMVDGQGMATGLHLSGIFEVYDNTIDATTDGIIIITGDCYVYDNTITGGPERGITVNSAGANVVIGPNVFRGGVSNPFRDFADTDTRFTDTRTAVWALPGLGSINTGVQRLYFSEQSYILSAALTADTAGTGSGSNTLDVHKNGTTIFTTQGNRPTLAAAANDSGVKIPDWPARELVSGDYLTIDIDAVTATTAASDMVALVRYVELPV